MARKRRRNATQTAPPGGLSAGVALTELERRQRRINLIAQRAAANANAGEPTPEQLRRNSYASVRTHDPVTGFPIHLRKCLSAPIDRLRARGMLTERQHAAAVRFRDDFDRSGLERQITGRYEGGGGGGGSTFDHILDASNSQIDARNRLDEARKQLPVRLRPAFEGLVCHDEEPRDIGEREGRTGTMAARFATEYIRICADILADYYRL